MPSCLQRALYLSAVCAATLQGAQTDVLLIAHPERLLIFNKYQQRLTSDESSRLVPFAPMVVVRADDQLGDGLTRCTTVRVGNDLFYLQTSHDGTLQGDGTTATPLGIATGGVSKTKLAASGGISGQVLGTDGTNLTWTNAGLSLPFTGTAASSGPSFAVTNNTGNIAIQGTALPVSGINQPGILGVGGGASTFTGDVGIPMGVWGASHAGVGVLGTSDNKAGVIGTGAVEGVVGVSGDGTGVLGESDTGNGVHGTSNSGYAGKF